jgi:hypothetical protein
MHSPPFNKGLIVPLKGACAASGLGNAVIATANTITKNEVHTTWNCRVFIALSLSLSLSLTGQQTSAETIFNRSSNSFFTSKGILPLSESCPANVSNLDQSATGYPASIALRCSENAGLSR